MPKSIDFDHALFSGMHNAYNYCSPGSQNFKEVTHPAYSMSAPAWYQEGVMDNIVHWHRAGAVDYRPIYCLLGAYSMLA